MSAESEQAEQQGYKGLDGAAHGVTPWSVVWDRRIWTNEARGGFRLCATRVQVCSTKVGEVEQRQLLLCERQPRLLRYSDHLSWQRQFGGSNHFHLDAALLYPAGCAREFNGQHALAVGGTGLAFIHLTG